MMDHPSIQDLMERRDEPSIVAHLQACGACRARLLMLDAHETEGSVPTLPELDAARRALADARRAASLSVGRSWGSDPLARPSGVRFLAVGRRIDRYEVRERIGVGAMGAVYRVEHTTLGSSHALKVVHLTDEEARGRLIREGQAQGRLQHTNVVPVTDVVDVDGEPGLVMAFVDGPSLSAWLADHGPPTVAVVQRLGEQIVRAVAAAHAAGIVHRDLKPRNVLIADTDEGPAARVCDFGLARSFDDIEGPRGPVGTPGYMAPEQIRDAGRADARSDLFAVGAVLYELATGRRAFDGADVAEVWRRIDSGTYVPPEAHRPELPAAQVRTIRQALAVDPADRFADAGALLASWRASSAPRPAAPVAPRSVLGWAAALALLCGVALAGWAVGRRPVASPAPAVAAPEVGDDAADRRLTAVGESYQIFAIALSADDERLLFADSRGLWEQRVVSGTPRRVFAGGPVHSVDWVDDETALVSMSGDDTPGTWLVDLPSGERRQVTDDKGGFARPSPDGRLVAIAGEKALRLHPLDGAEGRVLATMAPGQHASALAWSPDGAHLVALFMQGEVRPPWLERIDVATGVGTVLLQDMRLVALGLGAVEWVAPDRLLFARAHSPHDAGLYALDQASTVASAGDAELLRSWEGYQLIRLRAGGEGLVASRGTARSDVMSMTPGRPGLELLTPEDWNERPVGWTSDGVLLVSNRGGGGIYELGADGEVTYLDRPTGYLVDAWEVPGGQVMTWFRQGDDEETTVFEVVRVVDGAPTETLVHQPLAVHMEVAIRLEAARCVPGRCLLGHAADGALGFRWLDPVSGEQSELVAEVAYGSRPLVWALSPDGTQLSVLYADPSERLDVDLRTGATTTRPMDLDLPLAAAFGRDGRLFVAGATFRSLEPYRVVVLEPDGGSEVLQSSVNTNYSALYVSPDGTSLAVGANAFGTDVWWLSL